MLGNIRSHDARNPVLQREGIVSAICACTPCHVACSWVCNLCCARAHFVLCCTRDALKKAITRASNPGPHELVVSMQFARTL